MAQLLVDVEGIHRNTIAVAALLRASGLSLIAVTKGCLADVEVAAAMLGGGAVALADTHDAGLLRLRAAFPSTELHRIELPPLSSPFEPGDVTYISSVAAAEAVAVAGLGDGHPRRVMVQVETGDLREGVPVEQVASLVRVVRADRRLALEGVATNYACFEGAPDGVLGSVEALAGLARSLGAVRVSGGNSSVLSLLVAGASLPREVTELRCGESLLLGQDALERHPLPGCRQDACVLRAEVLEGYTKATRGGAARRLVVGIGLRDLGSGGVRFASPALTEAGRSSDYLVVTVAPGEPGPAPGESIEMIPDYYALAALWASSFVEVRHV
jgi:predicted amino acid racemase